MSQTKKTIKSGYGHYINDIVTIYLKKESSDSEANKRKIIKAKLLSVYPYELIVERKINDVKSEQGSVIDQHLIIPKHSIRYLTKNISK